MKATPTIKSKLYIRKHILRDHLITVTTFLCPLVEFLMYFDLVTMSNSPVTKERQMINMSKFDSRFMRTYEYFLHTVNRGDT